MRPVSTLVLLLALSVGSAALAQGAGSGAADKPSELSPIPVKPSAPAPAAPPQEPPASEPAPAPEPAAPPRADKPQPAPDAPLAARPSPRPVADPRQHQLVHGAPLHDPNVAVHVVQRKLFPDEGRHELTLYPLVTQVNARFTQHAGSAFHYTYHLRESVGLQLSTQYNWHSNESAFNLELIDKVREQARTATSLLLVWGVQGGLELTPLYGKFAFYDDFLAQFSVVLNGGVGVGSTRALIRPEVAHQVDGATFLVPARFGDTGMRGLLSVGGGLRVQLGQSFALRFEVRDLVYTARVDRVEGCNLADFDLLEQARTTGQPFQALPLSGSCRYDKFDGVDPETRKNYREDIVLGRDLVREPSSAALNNLGFYAGFSFHL